MGCFCLLIENKGKTRRNSSSVSKRIITSMAPNVPTPNMRGSPSAFGPSLQALKSIRGMVICALPCSIFGLRQLCLQYPTPFWIFSDHFCNCLQHFEHCLVKICNTVQHFELSASICTKPYDTLGSLMIILQCPTVTAWGLSINMFAIPCSCVCRQRSFLQCSTAI